MVYSSPLNQISSLFNVITTTNSNSDQREIACFLRQPNHIVSYSLFFDFDVIADHLICHPQAEKSCPIPRETKDRIDESD